MRTVCKFTRCAKSRFRSCCCCAIVVQPPVCCRIVVVDNDGDVEFYSLYSFYAIKALFYHLAKEKIVFAQFFRIF